MLARFGYTRRLGQRRVRILRATEAGRCATNGWPVLIVAVLSDTMPRTASRRRSGMRLRINHLRRADIIQHKGCRSLPSLTRMPTSYWRASMGVDRGKIV